MRFERREGCVCVCVRARGAAILGVRAQRTLTLPAGDGGGAHRLPRPPVTPRAQRQISAVGIGPKAGAGV